MKKKKIEGLKDTKIILPVVFLITGALLFTLEVFTGDLLLKNSIHFVFDPVTVQSEDIGESISEYVGVLADIPGAQRELNELRLKVSSYESKIEYLSILEEENESLREQLELGNEDHTYVEAKVLGKVQENTLRVNIGRLHGVEVGDTVLVGYSFIGIVMEVTDEISTIRLPYSKSSTLEVWVASKENESILSRAVISGGGEEYIYIENISKKSGVKEGDYVIINDERVVDNLVLGEISKLDDSPTNTSFNGEVLPVFDYDSLVSVFICIEW